MPRLRQRLEEFGVETRLYGAFAVLLFFGAVGYAIWSSWEAAGSVLLFLCAGFFVIVAGYLAFMGRLARTEAREATAGPSAETVGEDEEPYLPHASIWPLELGAGMTLALAGFALGWWIFIPGLVVTVHSLGGWLVQSRNRDAH